MAIMLVVIIITVIIVILYEQLVLYYITIRTYSGLFGATEQKVEKSFHHPACVSLTGMNTGRQHNRLPLLHHPTIQHVRNNLLNYISKY